MNDEELVEVMAEGSLADIWSGVSEQDRGYQRTAMRNALAALRSAGFQVFKPEDAIPVYVASRLSGSFARCEPVDADGFVVPADSEESG